MITDQCVSCLDISDSPALVSSLLKPPNMNILLSMEAPTRLDIALGRGEPKFQDEAPRMRVSTEEIKLS